jgi:hypothetical protein
VLDLAEPRGMKSGPTTRLIPGSLITRSSTMNRRAPARSGKASRG